MAQDFFEHTGLVVGEHREDRLGLAKGMAGGPVVPVEEDIEVVAVTGLGLEAVVLVPDDTHSAYLRHWACIRMVKGIRRRAGVEGAAAASHHMILKPGSSSSVCELGSLVVLRTGEM